MGTLAAAVAGTVVLGIALVAWLGRREGGGLGWLASRPTTRQLRLLRRGRKVPGRFLYARMLERRRSRRLP
jgi:hypothetical protein